MDIAVFYVSTTLMLMNVYSICKHIPDAPLRLVFAVYGSTLSLVLGVAGAQVAPITVVVIGFAQLVRHTI